MITPLDVSADIRRFGLHTWPFGGALPVSAYTLTPRMQQFLQRLPFLVTQGGFALVSGEPGTGKSTCLRIIYEQLREVRDMHVRVLSRPQASLADFYRELGAVFNVELRPHNRWRSAQALREEWVAHWTTASVRPVILVDEAQEATEKVLSELRLLASGELDQHVLASVILAGDRRLLDHLAAPDLAPLASRLGARCALEARSPEELQDLLRTLLEAAGNPALMTDEVLEACCRHAQGNCRSLMHLASELLEQACADPHCTLLDAALFNRLFDTTVPAARGKAAGRSRRLP